MQLIRSLPKLSINLSLASNLAACGMIALGFALHNHHIKSIGYYAFSGAITNWAAIYMLFERIPGIYGSGVIALRFEAFKASIKHMVMDQFFNDIHVKKFFQHPISSGEFQINLDPLLDSIDYDAVFDRLVDAIMASPLGGMLGMLGGKEAVESLRPSCQEQIRQALSDMAKSPDFRDAMMEQAGEVLPSILSEKVETLIDHRLNELTPQMVKNLVKQLIAEHMGWLVLWGAVFGGLLGGGLSFL